MTKRSRRSLIAVTVFLFLVIAFTLAFRVAIVHGDSMLPTFHDGELLLVNKMLRLSGPLRRGDVILLHHGNDILIKRIAYLPGDTIEGLRAFSFRRVAEFFDVDQTVGQPNPFRRTRLKVPPGNIVVLGDNFAVSDDSRSFGPISFSDVIGRVINAPAKR